MPIIAFCGIDGSGKSTQVDLLERWLTARGLRVDIERPVSPDSKFLRAVEELERRCEAADSRFPLESLGHIMACEALRNMNGSIRELSDKGSFVLCDRYLLTHPVYADAHRVDYRGIDALMESAPPASLTFLVDVPVDEALRRIQARAKSTGRNETREILDRARRAYVQRATESGAVILNGLEPPDRTHARIVEATSTCFSLDVPAAIQPSGVGPSGLGKDAC